MAGGSVRIDLDITDEFSVEVGRIAREWPGHRDAILRGLSEELVGELKRDIPTNTGRAKGTVRALETGTDKVEVVAGGESGVDYILPLLKGSKPHAPGPADPSQNKSLARWARRNSYPGGFGAIWGSIFRYGTEEHDFVSDPVARMRGNAGGIATQILRNRGAFE